MEEMILYTLLGAAVTIALVSVSWLLYHRTAPAPAPTYPLQLAGPDFTEHGGFRLAQLPGDEIIRTESCWARDGRAGEVRFTIEPAWNATLRVGRTGCDLGLEEYESRYDARSTLHFEGISVLHQHNPGGEALLLWSRQGYDYALHFPETEQGLAAGLADDFVLECIAETVV